MSRYSSDSSYEEMLVLYTYANPHEFEIVDEVAMIDELPDDVKLEYDEETGELSALVPSPMITDIPMPLSPSPATVDPNMLTSLLGRFSLNRPSFLQPGPSIAPKELSRRPEAPQPDAPLLGDIRNSVASAPVRTTNTAVTSKRPREVSFAESNKRAKTRRHSDENTLNREQPDPATRNASARTTSRSQAVSSLSKNKTASKGRRKPSAGKRASTARPDGRVGDTSLSGAGSVLHPIAEDALPSTLNFTFEDKPQISDTPVYDDNPSAPAEEECTAYPEQSAGEVDDVSPGREQADSPPPSPTTEQAEALVAPDTSTSTKTSPRSSLRLRTNITEESQPVPILHGVRKSKLKAMRRITQCASPSPSPPPQCHEPLTPGDTPDMKTECTDDAYVPDPDDQDADDERDDDFVPEPEAPRSTVKRKTRTAKVDTRRNGALRPKKTSSSRSAKAAFCYVRGGEERQYVRGRGDWKRRFMSELHGPVWCPFCNEDAPGPHDASQHSRVRDTPKRHLRSCRPFRESAYFARKKAEYVRKKGAGKTKDAEVIGYAAEAAVRDKKAAAVIIRCPNDPAQKALLKAARLEHADVLQALEPRSTVYKAKHCECCSFPHFSQFNQDK